jgi:hypothetical protein
MPRTKKCLPQKPLTFSANYGIRPRPHGMAHEKMVPQDLNVSKAFFDEWIEFFQNLDSLYLNSK